MPARGGGRTKSGGGGGGARPPPSREETISKAMAYVLRHGAEKEKLKLDESGYINCQDLLNWPRLRSLHVTFPELQTIVDTNAKKRFALIPRASSSSSSSSSPTQPSDYLIRASQGHSLAIASENLLTPLSPTDPACPDEVVHGTGADSWAAIRKSGGLKRMGRRHVHFAMGLPARGKAAAATSSGSAAEEFTPTITGHQDQDSAAGAAAIIDGEISTLTLLDSTAAAEPSAAAANEPKEQVVSGMRASADHLVWVDVKRSAAEGGLKWWKSANGVVLTEGDEHGVVALKWVRRVEVRATGEVVYKSLEVGKGDRDGEK
ncbi:MAG: hypothetical protein LQ339_008526 [Xanthoria mediterranea]|nr:MAG: hypothetical protein LQ339_008526 [Xanthoria mediterranea]